MDRSLGFESTAYNERAFHTRFRSASVPKALKLLHTVSRWGIMQKARCKTYQIVPQLLVSIWFHELFHSPPGVLFSVQSPYYPLSVYQEYLALEGGPPMFTPGFTGLALLRNALGLPLFPLRDYHSVWSRFPTCSSHAGSTTTGSIPRAVNNSVWADPISLAATHGISVDFCSSSY